MSLWSKIKNALRRIVPAGRTYLDAKFKELKKEEKQQNKSIQELQKAAESQQKAAKDQQKVSEAQQKAARDQQKMLKELQKTVLDQEQAICDLKEYIARELSRRDNWGKRAAQIKWEAAGRKLWVIKCPAPEGPVRVRWGDYAYAASLRKYLDRLGVYAVIDDREDWDCEEEADVVLVLRGKDFYRPDRRNAHCLYIMWNISHPEAVTPEEYNLYDVVCIASRHYAAKIAAQVRVPVLPLLQCTDTELFYPADTEPERYENDYIFIGNSRGVARRSVIWAAEDKLPLKIWGSGWKMMLGPGKTMVQETSIENSRIPELYRTSRATLNDHWKDMLDCQFVNNRIFDALACGLPVVSDSCEELREIFPDAVLYYETKEEFDECIRMLEEDYAAVKARVAAMWSMIREKYSFETRARELLEIVQKQEGKLS